MGNIVFLIIMVPISMLFTGLGVYAWKRKEPMWFFAGTTVSKDEIADIPAYNKANGMLWIGYSMIYWISSILGYFKASVGGIFMIIGCIMGSLALPLIYHKIYDKYRKNK